MKIRFTKTVTTKASPPETFVEGRTYDLNDASANHWLVRGAAEPVRTPEEVAADDADAGDGLDDMTAAELRGVAEAESIDLGGVTRKADVAAAIRAARAK